MRQNTHSCRARVSIISRRWVPSCTHEIMSVRFFDTTGSSCGHYRMASVWCQIHHLINCFQSWTELHVILWPTFLYFKTFTVSIETCLQSVAHCYLWFWRGRIKFLSIASWSVGFFDVSRSVSPPSGAMMHRALIVSDTRQFYFRNEQF